MTTNSAPNAMQDEKAELDRHAHASACALLEQGDSTAAEALLNAIVADGTSCWEVFNDLAAIALTRGDVDAALRHLQQAVSAQSVPGQASFHLATLQKMLGQFEPALATLSPLLRREPTNIEALTLVRQILGESPQLGVIAWARLVTDLRSPSNEQREMLKDYERIRSELAVLRAAKEHAESSNMTIPFEATPSACTDVEASTTDFFAALSYLNAHNLGGFKWFSDKNSYLDWDAKIEYHQQVIERHISCQNSFPGYCELCNKSTEFIVCSGLQLDGHPHLREGMVCRHCRIHNRGRLLGLSVRKTLSLVGKQSQVLLMETTTPLYEYLSSHHPNLIGSEFQSATIEGGAPVSIGGKKVRHENILCLSFNDQSLDVVAHADLLEHVPDVETALKECFRVLRPGGQLLFSAPFHQTMSVSRKRATLSALGEIIHLSPAEYHGTHLAYYNFGWDLLDMCLSAGFSSVRLGVRFEPLQGLLSTGRFGGYYMQPIVISCSR